MKRILFRLLFIPLLFVVSCESCSKRAGGPSGTAGEKVLVLDNYADAEELDPTLIHAAAGTKISINLFEGLTDFDPKTLEPIPGVATHWKIANGGRTYTFSLRKNAMWSDGSPVTAHDFVYSWRRAVDPITASQYAFMLGVIKNGNAITTGTIKDTSKLGVKAINDHTLEVELENPTPYFLSLTAWLTLRPVKQEVVEKYGEQWTRPEHMVSNGYFKLVEWTPLKRIVLEPNPHYWDRKQVKIDRAIFLPLEDRDTALKMFMNGQTHSVYEVPNIKVPSLKNHPEFVIGPYLATFSVTFNVTKPPLTEKRVRQALAMAIDRQKLTQVINKGIPHDGLVPIGLGSYISPPGPGFDPKHARELLAEAGYADPKTFPKLTITYNTNSDYKLVMETLQSMWKENLGINTELINMEWKSYLSALKAGEFEIARHGWIGDYEDPDTFIRLFTKGHGSNFSRWSHPEYEALVASASETTDNQKRFASFQQAERLLLDEAPLVALYTWTLPIMVSKKITGFHHTIRDIHPLKGVDLKNDEVSNVLVLDNAAEPEYLDPGLISGVYEAEIVTQLFEGLLAYDPKTLEPVPGVAESWKISPDAKIYTFTLRKNAKWSDGSPVTAHDFVYSWRRVVDPKTAGKFAYQMYYVKNGKGISEGTIADLSRLGATAIDDHTLRVELENSTPFFLDLAAFHTYNPVKKEVVETYGDRWTRPEHMVSNGYFKLVEWTPNKQIMLEPNPHYWDRENVKLDRVTYLPLDDRDTALKLYLNGQSHYVWEIPTIKIESLQQHNDYRVSSELSTYHLFFNTKQTHLAEKKVRQALAHAIDREQLVKVVNLGIPHDSFTPQGIQGYNPPKGLDFDPQKAKQLLSEAGYGVSQQFPETTISYNTSGSNKLIMEVIQSMWKQHLGIEVKLLNMDWKTLNKNWQAHDFDITRMGWVGDYLDPNTFLEVYTAKSGNNHTNWGNSDYDGLLVKASQTTDRGERFSYFHQAETMLLDEAPIIPLFTYTRPKLISPNLIGFYPNLRDNHPLKGVSLKKE